MSAGRILQERHIWDQCHKAAADTSDYKPEQRAAGDGE